MGETMFAEPCCTGRLVGRGRPMEAPCAVLRASPHCACSMANQARTSPLLARRPVDEWPVVECLLSWHSDGFPLAKAQASYPAQAFACQADALCKGCSGGMMSNGIAEGMHELFLQPHNDPDPSRCQCAIEAPHPMCRS